MTPKTTLPSVRDLLEGFFHLLYPDLCVACQHDLPVRDTCFCLRCRLKNAPFDLSDPDDNEFTTRLWGRLPMKWGVAAYHFTRKSPIQRALHQLKYHNKPEIGLMMGRELGKRMLVAQGYGGVEGIIPVPLHPRKERERGYNQSAMFAQGISEILQVPVWANALQRKSFTSTQTRKKRMERFENVGDVFEVVQEQALSGKHLLLVDDVLTTGATLEMCGRALLDIPGTQLSLATIAIADR